MEGKLLEPYCTVEQEHKYNASNTSKTQSISIWLSLNSSNFFFFPEWRIHKRILMSFFARSGGYEGRYSP